MDILDGLEKYLGWWVVPLLLLVIWLGVFILVSIWQRQLHARLRKVVPGFKHVQLECKEIAADLRPYSPDDRPPYGTLAVVIQRHLDSIANHLVALKKDYITIQDRIHRMRFRTWQKVLGAPFYWYTWYQLRVEAGYLVKNITDLDGLVKDARDRLGEINRQAWLVAVEARQVLELEKEVRRLMEFLGDHKLTGVEFESAAAQEEKAIDSLDLVPRYFFIADEASISTQATKESVSTVYGIVTEVRPILEDLQKRLIKWEQDYQALSARATQMQQQVVRAKNILSSLPGNLIVTEQSEQIRSMETLAGAITETLSRLDVASIPLVDEEIERTSQAAIEVGGGIRRGLRQHTSLSLLIVEMTQIQKDLSGLITGLAKSPKYPVVWDQSRSTFRELNKQISTLGEANQPRPVMDINPSLDKASHLRERLIELSDHCWEISTQHSELVEFLEGEVIQQLPGWCQRATELAGEVAVYHADNWSRKMSVATFMEDIRYLSTRYQAIIPADSTQSLQESEIRSSLADVSNLLSGYKTLHERADEIETRLRLIQNTEKEARDKLSTARNQFHQISWLVNSNNFLKGIAAGELERMRQALERQSQVLGQPQSDLVEKKASQTKAVIDELDARANRWLEQLNQDILQRQRGIAAKLEKMREYAVLEDPAIEKAKRLETINVQRSPQGQTTPTFHLSLEDVVGEMQRCSNTWQECVAVQQELEELVETPLTDAVQHAQKQRDRTLELLTHARRQLPEGRSWPATDVDILEQQRIIEQLETQWAAMKTQQVRAIWAVRRYGELAASYQTQASKIEQALQWASQEQKRILDAEAEIERLMRYLQRQELSATNDPRTAEQFNRIRIKAGLALDKIKHEWLTGSDSNMEFDDVMESLLNILSSLRSSIEISRETSDQGD